MLNRTAHISGRAPPAGRRTIKQRPEQIIQKAVADHLRTRGVRGLVWWHTPNNTYTGARNRKGRSTQGGILKSLGVRAGVSDILAFHNGKLFCLELKAPNGTPTESQLEFISDIQAAGGYGVVAEGLPEALQCLEFWGLLRGQTQ